MNGDDPSPTVHDQWLDPGERQAAARSAYQRSVDEGAPVSAATLAARFDRSPRWAQDRIAEVRNHRRATTTLGSDNGSHGTGHAALATRSAATRAPVGGHAQRLDTAIVALVDAGCRCRVLPAPAHPRGAGR